MTLLVLVRRSRIASLAAVLLAATLLYASPHAHAAPAFRKSQVFFHCTGDHRLANANGTPQLWNSTAPAGAQPSNGCVFGEETKTAFSEPPLTVAGEVVGNVRDLTLSAFIVSDKAAIMSTIIWLRGTVDGEPLFAGNGYKPIGVTPVATATPGVYHLEFSITGMGLVDGDQGEGTTRHRLSFSTECSDGIWGACLWLYDSTDAPAGIVFNPDTLAPSRIDLEQ